MLKISEIEFRAGSSQGEPRLKLATGSITIFVGPNYSGKSQAVAEIAHRCNVGYLPAESHVLSSVIVEPLNSTDAESAFQSMILKPNKGEIVAEGHSVLGRRGDRYHITKSHFFSSLSNTNEARNPYGSVTQFAQHYSRYRYLLLDGQNRIGLMNDQPAGDMQMPPVSTFQQLFRNDVLRTRLSSIVYDAFKMHLVVDPTQLGTLRLRLSRQSPPSPEFERALTEDAITFFGNAVPVMSTSDGAKAFIGIMAEILAGNPDVLLMDEPEAFLHPSLAFTLGREVSTQLSKSNKQMFVSTHSPQFLMGCIQSGVDINVVRLTYRDGVATARLLPSGELKSMMRNPLLRSTGVLSALFYESVVVTEADPDRAFYQEINERLLREGSGRGIANAIFLNAQNKQTIPTILRPLRNIGIPAAAIYDLDFVKDGGGVATNLLSSAGIPSISIQPLTALRSAVHEALKSASSNFKTEGGIQTLSGDRLRAAQDYLDGLKEYGAFLVPGGELESWLASFGIKGHGPSWLIPMFERLGEDPESSSYVHPGAGDVWQFIDDVRGWLQNSSRKGIPQ